MTNTNSSAETYQTEDFISTISKREILDVTDKNEIVLNDKYNKVKVEIVKSKYSIKNAIIKFIGFYNKCKFNKTNNLSLRYRFQYLAGIRNTENYYGILKLPNNATVNLNSPPKWTDRLKYKLCGFKYTSN